ncbi:hypothetical protein B0H13DRAFT_2309928 [Mycena leptocephala]|nr:hypothetical protein B0H13DRAFT_2309928 [Mycena leptocephala]
MPIAEDEHTGGDAPSWYAITRGLYVGITLSNALAVSAVVGVCGSSMKGYTTQAFALAAFNELLAYNMPASTYETALRRPPRLRLALHRLTLPPIGPALLAPFPLPIYAGIPPPPLQHTTMNPPRGLGTPRNGIATQGVVCASVHTVERATSFPKTKKKAYVVFCGLRCGVVLTWPEARALVHNVRNCTVAL